MLWVGSVVIVVGSVVIVVGSMKPTDSSNMLRALWNSLVSSKNASDPTEFKFVIDFGIAGRDFLKISSDWDFLMVFAGWRKIGSSVWRIGNSRWKTGSSCWTFKTFSAAATFFFLRQKKIISKSKIKIKTLADTKKKELKKNKL